MAVETLTNFELHSAGPLDLSISRTTVYTKFLNTKAEMVKKNPQILELELFSIPVLEKQRYDKCCR
jgi:hypothetical protein